MVRCGPDIDCCGRCRSLRPAGSPDASLWWFEPLHGVRHRHQTENSSRRGGERRHAPVEHRLPAGRTHDARRRPEWTSSRGARRRARSHADLRPPRVRALQVGPDAARDAGDPSRTGPPQRSHAAPAVRSESPRLPLVPEAWRARQHDRRGARASRRDDADRRPRHFGGRCVGDLGQPRGQNAVRARRHAVCDRRRP